MLSKAHENVLVKKGKLMQSYGDNFTLVISVEDDLLHTATNPFCFDPTCGCHEDQELIASVAGAVTYGLLTDDEATRFVKGQMLY